MSPARRPSTAAHLPLMIALARRALASARKRAALSRRIARLAADPASAARMVASYNSGPIRKRLGRPGLLPVEVDLAYLSHRFPIRFERVFEYHVLLEVFGELEYALELDFEPRTILDLGANVGLSTIFFRLTYPDAHLHAVEADPSAFRALTRNLRRFSGITLHHLAVGGADGMVPFYASPDHSISSSLHRRRPEQHAVEVPCVSLETLLDRIGADEIDLVKFDVEGAERPLFERSRALRRLRHLIGELHLELTGWTPEDLATCFGGFDLSVRRRAGDRAIVELGRRAPIGER